MSESPSRQSIPSDNSITPLITPDNDKRASEEIITMEQEMESIDYCKLYADTLKYLQAQVSSTPELRVIEYIVQLKIV